VEPAKTAAAAVEDVPKEAGRTIASVLEDVGSQGCVFHVQRHNRAPASLEHLPSSI